MEIANAEEMESQHSAFMKFKHSVSLSKSKVAFARKIDSEKSLVLRNLYPKINDLQSVFLLIGKNHMETLFYSLLLMMKEKMETLRRRVKYVKKEDFEEVLRAIEEKKEKIGELGRLLREKQELLNEGLLVRFSTGEDGICLKVFAGSEFPGVRFTNETKEKEYCNSCDLFVGETIKLMRYLNSRFDYTQTDTLKVKCKSLAQRQDLVGCM